MTTLSKNLSFKISNYSKLPLSSSFPSSIFTLSALSSSGASHGNVTHTARFREVYHNTDSIDPLYTICKKPKANMRLDPTRRAHFYVMMGGLYGTAGIGVKKTIGGIILYLGQQPTVLATTTIEIKLADIPEGSCSVHLLGDTPFFVWHRTPKQIQLAEEQDNTPDFRDPAKDGDRVLKKEWLIAKAVCTHLGCVPIFGQGNYGGFFCPCHGSHYDASARIRKGPAPKNLEIPTYKFTDEGTLILGDL